MEKYNSNIAICAYRIWFKLSFDVDYTQLLLVISNLKRFLTVLKSSLKSYVIRPWPPMVRSIESKTPFLLAVSIQTSVKNIFFKVLKIWYISYRNIIINIIYGLDLKDNPIKNIRVQNYFTVFSGKGLVVLIETADGT